MQEMGRHQEACGDWRSRRVCHYF